ncbi:hypothetical protein INT47_001646 [Mucor saturninus]|uniref:Uncharacterized protein n=1 Tax=Mucor saturninus TaxID=64648 RepID=A0A8H7VB56_9FUNG|nr:hypothetical protein INT47_001646 [Mucor saturninus]
MSLLFVRKNAIPNDNVEHGQQDQDEIVRLQSNNSHSTIQSQPPGGGGIDSERRTIYNSSTIGIPPSSFLAPTGHTSIRSSSLDYVPPPPAYQDMIYPPSYRSTNSTKDDNVSIVY